ncbi:MAG TPA: DUF1566 domain-containing protein [Oligoflexus sp.]|uniref:Lcl C-terminal domain-containing protein n=1 Tax=Oligoflexus sp. TaxID=1971216 RepID=UPI002D80EE7D|nr:DUF1566 domain-containing protein [Oligoflexus sp.]HET9236776.1 DUF1566 domain-containing protein [Oligoflexus sp.]
MQQSMGFRQAFLPILLFFQLTACRDEVSVDVVERVPASKDVAVTYESGSRIIVSQFADKKNHPLVLSSPASICSDITYYNAEGALSQGTRDCDSLRADPNLTASNIRTGVTILGIKGTLQSVDETPELIPANIRSGVAIGGITGTMTSPPADCFAEGETGCVITGSFKATQISQVAGKVIAGQTVAGVNGNVTLPSSGKVLSGTTYGSNGSLSGTLTLPATTAVLTGTGAYGDPSAALVPAYAPDFPSAANVRNNDTVNGVTGTLGDCTTDGSIACLANGSYPAADMSLATAGNIRSGVTIAGQLGAYPSGTYRLPSASTVADLTDTNFATQMKSATAFEYWGSDGSHHTGAGDADIAAANLVANIDVFGTLGTAAAVPCSASTETSCIADNACRWTGSACELNPWNIRSGISLSGQLGLMKTNCRNRANSAIYNSDFSMPGTAGTTAGLVVDWWDSINNHNANLNALPTELPTGWTAQNVCGKELWSDMTSDGACDSAADNCVMRDNNSGQIWSESYPVASTAPAVTKLDWSQAVAHCDDLDFGGRTDWRLPTNMELTAVYHHGIRELGFKGGGSIRPSGDSLDNNDMFISDVDTYVWSATMRSSTTGTAEYVYLGEGRSSSLVKTDNATISVLCTAP